MNMHMKSGMPSNYLPEDHRLVDQIVHELKSQGIFDQFRKECISDVDTKPAYQNLRQRVESSVTSFLKQQNWRPDLNKNQVRENLRKNIHESGFLETGVERIVDQVVNPKINSVFLPQVEEVFYKFYGINKPTGRDGIKKEKKDGEQSLKIDVTQNDLLPEDLEAVSPDSVITDKKEDNLELLDDSHNADDAKMDDEESPPFEPLEEQIVFVPQEENSVDSHMSGFSGLASHESNHSSNDMKGLQMELSNQDSQMSRNSSESRLSIVTSDDNTKQEEAKISNEIKAEEKEEIINKNNKSDEKKSSSSSRDSSKYSKSRKDDKDKKSSSKDKSRSSSSSKDKDRHTSRERKDSKSSSNRDNKDKNRSSSSSSNKHRDKSSSRKDRDKSKSSSSSKSKKSSSGDKSKHNGRHSSSSSSSKRDKDKKRDSKPDDHYSSKEKKTDRRSTDRDSNDGQPSRSTTLPTNGDKNSNPTKTNTQESNGSTITTSGSGDSNSDKTETKFVKLNKPKFASNIHEAKRLMKIRKKIALLEKQNNLEVNESPANDKFQMVHGPVLNKDAWDALEAKLFKEMSNISNSYEDLSNSTTNSEMKENDECFYLEKPSKLLEKHREFLINYVENLEKEVNTKKRQFNNNNVNNNNNGAAEKKKRKILNAETTQTVLLSNENFSLPLSPAESDVSNEQIRRDEVIVPKQRNNNRSDLVAKQRYSSDDLYKPRPTFTSSRRRGGTKNVEAQ